MERKNSKSSSYEKIEKKLQKKFGGLEKSS